MKGMIVSLQTYSMDSGVALPIGALVIWEERIAGIGKQMSIVRTICTWRVWNNILKRWLGDLNYIIRIQNANEFTHSISEN